MVGVEAYDRIDHHSGRVVVFHPAECRSPQAMGSFNIKIYRKYVQHSLNCEFKHTLMISHENWSRTVELPSIHTGSTIIEMTVFPGIKSKTI